MLLLLRWVLSAATRLRPMLSDAALVRLRWVLLAIAAVVLVLHSLAYNFVTDDAYISFVFSRNFAEHGQLTFNLGHPVEGYTNFLWTLILGIGMLIGISPEISSRVLGTLCALGTLYFAFRVVERAMDRKTCWAALPPLLLACSSGFACWTSGGLETQLFTLLVTAALDGYVAAATDPRALRRVAICLALAAMTRPEGPLVAAVLGLAYAGQYLGARIARSVEGWPLRQELYAAAWFLGLWLPWFAWRWWYYGYPFPNTYYVKASGPWADPQLAGQMRDNGFYYMWIWLEQTGLVYASPFAALGLIARPRTPRFALGLACGLLVLVYVPYTISVGGDFMGLHRFIMPLFVVAAILVTLGLEWLASLAPWRELGWLAAVLVIRFAWTQYDLTIASLDPKHTGNDHGIDTPAFLIVYTEDRAAIGRAMAGCFTDEDFSIVGGAGAQPYYGRMQGIDVFGLVSEKIAHDSPRIRARAGHTKFGSDAVLADYDPTFVMSCYQIHARPEQPKLPCAGYWLAKGYEEITMHVPGMREQGEYYTFLGKRTRNFQCPGRVH
jgi:arabinofuranosyltransferase